MKQLIILAVMLRVWWITPYHNERHGIVLSVQKNGDSAYQREMVLTVRRDDTGQIENVRVQDVQKSAWVEVKP